MSIHSLFNDNWQFAKFPLNTPYETMSEAVSFCPVAIPHDWQIWDTSDLYENSIGFYKKVFTLKKENFHKTNCSYFYTSKQRKRKRKRDK